MGETLILLEVVTDSLRRLVTYEVSNVKQAWCPIPNSYPIFELAMSFSFSNLQFSLAL